MKQEGTQNSELQERRESKNCTVNITKDERRKRKGMGGVGWGRRVYALQTSIIIIIKAYTVHRKTNPHSKRTTALTSVRINAAQARR